MKQPFHVDVRANHSGVTGSCFHLKAVFPNRDTYSFLIDCGMFQGKNETIFNNIPINSFIKPKGMASLILTHNHVDHVGRVMELVRAGFSGRIYTSKETAGLLDKTWNDCCKIEEVNARFDRRNPKFTEHHVSKALRLLKPIDFKKKEKLRPGVSITLIPNGHVFGAAMVLVEISAAGSGAPPINFLFTGDYNSENYFFTVPRIPKDIRNMPIHIVCESTYGQRSRQDNREKVFVKNILTQIGLGKVILVPTFGFERGQRVFSEIRRIQDDKKLSDSVLVYGDGTNFRANTLHYENRAKVSFDKVQKLLPKGLRWIKKTIQREEILSNREPKIIVASGGMLSFGPSRIYLPHFVQNPNGVIHCTGYQCEGSNGYKLKMAKETGKLYEMSGKLIKVECEVFFTGEFSAHASVDDLLDLIGQFPNRKSVSSTHGSAEAKYEFAKEIISAKLAKEVAILTRGNVYRFSPYKLENVIQDV